MLVLFNVWCYNDGLKVVFDLRVKENLLVN